MGGRHRPAEALEGDRRFPSYHGGTLGALAVTGDGADRNLCRPDADDADDSGADRLSRPRQSLDGTARHRNMPTCWRRRSSPRDRKACVAFIMEPIGGAATAALVAPDSYYPRIREICDRYGILLIHDEVMSGVGAHRQVPRRRSLELPARHHRAVEGHRLRLCAARRHGRADAAGEAGARHGRLPARPHLCRQSARLRGRPGGARREWTGSA